MLRKSSNTLYKKLARYGLCLLLVLAVQYARAQEVMVDTSYSSEENYYDEEEDSEYSKDEQPYVPEAPEFREVPEPVVDSLKRDEDFAYANDDDYWKKEKKKEQQQKSSNSGFWNSFYNFFADKTVRVIAYILIGGLIVYLIIKVIIQNNLYLFYNSKKLKTAGMEEEELEMDPETLDEKLKKALAEKNHRLAVRYFYLKTLQLLNDRGLIRLHAQATNYQYLQQMSGNRLADEFRFLTDVYDYVWYGEFPLSEYQFERVDTNFRSFFQAVKS